MKQHNCHLKKDSDKIQMNTVKPKATTKTATKSMASSKQKKKIKNNPKIRKGEKKDIENIGDKKINGKMVDLNLTISIITLNGNDKNIAL